MFDHVKYVRSGHPDMTHRQMAMLMIVHERGQMTVRALAETLNVQKPVITRGVTTLSELGLLRRVADKNDGRNVFIVSRPKLARFLTEVMG